MRFVWPEVVHKNVYYRIKVVHKNVLLLKRYIYEKLLSWKVSSTRMPLYACRGEILRCNRQATGCETFAKKNLLPTRTRALDSESGKLSAHAAHPTHNFLTLQASKAGA